MRPRGAIARSASGYETDVGDFEFPAKLRARVRDVAVFRKTKSDRCGCANRFTHHGARIGVDARGNIDREDRLARPHRDG